MSHTYATKDGWRIHHNGGFDGDITIVFKHNDTYWTEHRTTSKIVLAWVRDHYGKPEMVEEIEVSALRNDGEPVTLTIPLSLLASFVADRYIRRRLEEWLEDAEDEDLLKLLPFVASLPDAG